MPGFSEAAPGRRLRAPPLVVTVSLLLVGPGRGAAQTPTLTPLPDSVKPLRVVDVAWIDTTVHACSDFFQYANGAWLAHDTIPAAYASSGVARDMSDRNELVVRSVLEDAVAGSATLPPANTSRKLGTFYGSCMDSAAAQAVGVAPARPWLAAVAGITTRARLVPEIAALQRQGIDVAFRYAPAADPHDAAHYLAWLSQGGLGLPDRDYYTNVGPGADSIRQHYVEHVTRLLALGGEPPADATSEAQLVLAFETALAEVSLTRVARREPAATDHPMSVTELGALAPRTGWSRYFRRLGLTVPVARVNVAEPAFVRRVDSLLVTAPLAQWRAYLRYHVLATAAPG